MSRRITRSSAAPFAQSDTVTALSAGEESKEKLLKKGSDKVVAKSVTELIAAVATEVTTTTAEENVVSETTDASLVVRVDQSFTEVAPKRKGRKSKNTVAAPEPVNVTEASKKRARTSKNYPLVDSEAAEPLKKKGRTAAATLTKNSTGSTSYGALIQDVDEPPA